MLNLLTLLNLLPLILVSASPVQKRFTNSLIVSQRTGKCLASTNAVGAPVNLVDCAQGSKWDINPGSGSVILSGSGLALDAGSNPANFGRLKVWTSYPGLFQQTWFLTGDNRIAITGGDQCLDDDGTNLQTYQCTTGNTNQIFTVKAAPPPPSSSSVAPSSSVSPPPSSSSSQPPASSSAAPAPGGGTLPVGYVYPDPPNGGRRLHPVGRNDLCLTALDGGNANGQLMAVTYCFPNDSPNAANQLFDVPNKNSQGLIKLHSKDFCIDAGSNPSNGGVVKIWQCYNGLFQQTWYYANDGKISLSSNQCIDVTQGSQPGTQKPYNSLRDLQTYQCFAGNTNQMFQLYDAPK